MNISHEVIKMKGFKSRVLTFKSTEIGYGLENIAKDVLVHIKANQKVYIQIGKVCIYATITATGLLMTDVICHASDFSAPAWAEAVDKKGLDLYWIAAAFVKWVIIFKAVADVIMSAVHGEIRKAPSIATAYGVVICLIYSLPWILATAQEIFAM